MYKDEDRTYLPIERVMNLIFTIFIQGFVVYTKLSTINLKENEYELRKRINIRYTQL